jgi:hypothetical protein
VVNRWLSTAKAEVQSHINSLEIYGGKGGTRAGILQVLWIPLPVLILPNASFPSATILAWLNGLFTA